MPEYEQSYIVCMRRWHNAECVKCSNPRLSPCSVITWRSTKSWLMYVHEKNHIWWGQTSYKRSLDSAVSSLLALISREYAQLIVLWIVVFKHYSKKLRECSGFHTEGGGPGIPPPENLYSLILMHDTVAVPHKLLPPPPPSKNPIWNPDVM